jgi:pimeloyl-ACP methyl ester carboxylesterase
VDLNRPPHSLRAVLFWTVARGPLAAATKKGTRFLFIHGDKDETAPYSDVVEFAKRVSDTANRRPAEHSVVPDMGHSPATKDYEAAIAAITRFVRAP